MSFISRLLGRNSNDSNTKVGGMEDFMTLIRVYLQATIAAQVGITNLAALPDLRLFKQTLKVPTVNNKLGVGEKKRCAQMLQDMYGLDTTFTTEIDQSIKRRCRHLQEVQPYMLQFQGFSQDLMMLMGNIMQWKLRLPSFLHKALRSMTEKSVHDIMTKADWNDEGVRRTAAQVRRYQQHLGFSEKWTTDYAYTTLMLAKREKRANIDDSQQK